MPQEPSSVRRALIIGVNAYTRRPLDGCVADAKAIEQLLRDRFAFDAANIRLLLDGAATRDAVLSELDEIVDLTQPGDVAFLFYAGHGSISENDADAESSGFDSTLMVSDTPRQDILDDEIQERLAALGAKTPHTVMIFDACHSGTIARSADAEPKGRWYPAIKRSELSEAARAGASSRSASATPGEKFTIISACRDDEIAKEAAISGDDATSHGALTFALVTELQRAASGDTWRDVFDRVSQQVTKAHRDQHPQIDGAGDREIFGLRDIAPMPHVLVTDRATQSVSLAAGALQGVVAGQKYTIYPAGTKDIAGVEPLGTVEVIVVKGTASRAKIVSEREPGAIVIGSRAVTAEKMTVAAALAMDNLKPDSRLRGAITLEILRRGSDDKWSVAENDTAVGMPVFESGERIAFRISSTLDEPVFVNLFDFDPAGSVGALTKGTANKLARAKVFEIGTDTRKIALKWESETPGVESFKVFASVREIDLSYLTRLDEPSRATEEIAPLDVDDWSTHTRQVHLRRKA
jgi:Caspase domain